MKFEVVQKFAEIARLLIDILRSREFEKKYGRSRSGQTPPWSGVQWELS